MKKGKTRKDNKRESHEKHEIKVLKGLMKEDEKALKTIKKKK